MKIPTTAVLLTLGLLGTLWSGQGCGGSHNSVTSYAPDFAIYDPAFLKNVRSSNVIAPGGTAQFPISLVSENGWKQPLTVQISNVPSGWTATISKTSMPSLPKGVTMDMVTVTAPKSALENTELASNFMISATSGGITRLLNDTSGLGLNFQNPPFPVGGLDVSVAGISIDGSAGRLPLLGALPNNAASGKFYASLTGLGLSGPVSLSLVNSTPGLTVSLDQSSIAPGTDGAITSGSIAMSYQISSSLGAGQYTFTIAAADAKDGYSCQAVGVIELENITYDPSVPPLTIPGHTLGSKGSTTFKVSMVGYPGQTFTFGDQEAGLYLSRGMPYGVTGSYSPPSVTLPASGSLTTNVTLTAEVTGSVAPNTYPNSVVDAFSADFGTIRFPLRFTLVIN